jgi:hypothetical protein
MRHPVRTFAFALALLAGLGAALAPAVQATAPPDRVALFAKAKLSRENVLGLLLLLLSRELAQMHEAMEALYEAGYISTASGGHGAVDRVLAGAMAARYDDAKGDLFAALMEYQKMVSREAREDRRLSKSRLANATARIAMKLGADERARFSSTVRDWLEFLARCVGGLSDAELDMLQLQELLNHRQKTLQLIANLVAALDEASRQIASNIGGGGGGGAAPGGPESLASGSDSVSDPGCTPRCNPHP